MNYCVITIICIILFCSCSKYDNNKPTEFFLIDSAKSYTGVFQAFVIYNPPKDTLILRKMVENYNLRTIPVNLLRQYKRYTRVFYTKSKFLTRDFKAGAIDKNPQSPHTYQELNLFSDYILMNIRYTKSNDNDYKYIYYFKDIAERKSIIINNLDSFYHAKWIETADIDTMLVK